MNIVLGIFLVFVAASYVFFWIVFKSIRDRKIKLGLQVQEKAELLTYALANERKAKEQVKLANSSKKNLLSRINHEIRTPLNGIIGMASLLDDTSLNQEQQDYNETIRSCSEGLLTTINDILLGDVLAHAKVDSDKSEVQQKDFDLRTSIEEVFDVFASQTALANLELVYLVDSQIPSNLIGDNLKLGQVLMNLVENAIMFTREGEIFIKVYQQEKRDNALRLGFEIHDTGLGMPAEKIKLLSTSFSSSEEATAHQTTDNGLRICKQLIEMMGGELHIESVKGKGTVVKFTIQVAVDEQSAPPENEMTAVAGKRILVVEDNVTLQHALKEEITNWELVPILASSAAQAMEILSTGSNIDMVLVEMQMPEMDGMTLGRLIRQNYPSLPIVLITVAGDLESKKHPEIITSVIAKPLRYRNLSQHILSGLMQKELDPLADNSRKLSVDFAQKYPLRILIAEDNRVNQKLAMKVLAKLGYDPDIAGDGKEVLEEISKIKYDLILMDVQMPEMDGLEATRMIRLCIADQPIIIAMTANAMQGDREKCLQSGMDDYISKPVHIEELVIMLEKWALSLKDKI